jgi:hypothetical protein
MSDDAKPVVTQIKPANKPSVPKKKKIATGIKTVINAPEKKEKKSTEKVEPKVKVVRDSFTMPQNDYAKLGELKQVCLKAGMQVKKSELLRAGLNELKKLSSAQLKKVISELEQIKTGRPKKS